MTTPEHVYGEHETIRAAREAEHIAEQKRKRETEAELNRLRKVNAQLLEAAKFAAQIVLNSPAAYAIPAYQKLQAAIEEAMEEID